MDNKQLGYKFEYIAENYLKSKWYKILNKNFTIRWWEIDIIVEKNWIVSFVEVKWSSLNMDFQNYITSWKIKSLKKTARTWIYRYDNEKIKGYRFDLILIEDWKINDFIEWFLD